MNLHLLDLSIFFFAWLFQAFTGFGAGIFIVGVMSLYYNPKVVIVSSAPVNLLGTVLMAVLLFNRVKPRIGVLIMLIAGSIPGIFLGSKMLIEIDRASLKLLIGTFIIILGVYDLAVQRGFLKRLSLKESGLGSLGAGFLGGLFAGLIGMGGPPPVVYLNQVIKDVEEFKSTLTLFFISNILFRMLFYRLEGGMEFFHPYLLASGAVAVPLGVTAGLILSRKFRPATVKSFISVSVTFLGLALVIEPWLW